MKNIYLFNYVWNEICKCFHFLNFKWNVRDIRLTQINTRQKINQTNHTQKMTRIERKQVWDNLFNQGIKDAREKEDKPLVTPISRTKKSMWKREIIKKIIRVN